MPAIASDSGTILRHPNRPLRLAYASARRLLGSVTFQTPPTDYSGHVIYGYWLLCLFWAGYVATF